MENDPKVDSLQERKTVVNRFGLITAVIGLSVATCIVIVVAGYYAASLAMWWQPEPKPDVIEVPQVETAVSASTETAVIASLKEPLQERTLIEDIEEENQIVLSNQFTAGQKEPSSAIFSREEESETALGQLIIPALNINRSITPVPLRDGQWDIAGLSTEVGHLASTGTFPGDDLAMTFIGHVTVPWPETGPFADLILLEHGEEVIYRWNGMDYIYQVERIFRAHPSNVDLLYDGDGSKINLVTCSGWDFIDREYDERLVTRAVLVRQEPTPQTLEQ